MEFKTVREHNAITANAEKRLLIWIAERLPGYPPVNPGTPSVHDVVSALHRLQEAGQVVLTETTPLDATQVRLP